MKWVFGGSGHPPLLVLQLSFFFFCFWGFLHLGCSGGNCCGSLILRVFLDMGSARFSRCRTVEALVVVFSVLGMVSLCCGTRLESGSRQKLEVQKHLRRLNKPAVKTIEVCFLFKWGFDSGGSSSVWFLGKWGKMWGNVGKWVFFFIFSGTKQGWMCITSFPFLLEWDFLPGKMFGFLHFLWNQTRTDTFYPNGGFLLVSLSLVPEKMWENALFP